MSDKNVVLGIDGGGTKTSFTLMDECGDVLQSFVLKGTSFDTYTHNEIKEVFSEGNRLIHHKPKTIFAGIGGILSENDKAICNGLLKDVFETEYVASDNDVTNALYGLNPKGDGIILIAGTGSVAYGKNGLLTHRAGGYCYQEGDLGSSYYLGMRALQHLGKTLDGREKESGISAELKSKLAIKTQIEFADFMKKAKRDEVASLAVIVTRHQNEEMAKTLIIDAVNETYLMVKAVYERIKADDSELPFGTVGGLINAKTLYRELILRRINEEMPLLKISEETIGAGRGSAHKALEMLWNG